MADVGFSLRTARVGRANGRDFGVAGTTSYRRVGHSRAGAGLPDAVADRTPTVAVVGLGYVGLPTALALSHAGMAVVGVDHSADRITAIRAKRVDLLPSRLQMLSIALDLASFHLTTDHSETSCADTVIICVPTPVDEHLAPELAAVREACASVAAAATAGQLIILSSTSYVGTTRDLLVAPLNARGFEVGVDINVASSAERLDPGNGDFPQSRVPRVVGGATDACTKRAAELLGTIGPEPHVVSSLEAAELTKLFENTFRAVNIALANEFADVSREFGIPVDEVIAAAATKPYGFMPFLPGPGVGGHCIPCDPHYLLWQLRACRVQAPVIEKTMDAIAHRPGLIVDRAIEVLADAGVGPQGMRLLVLGVAYKASVEDVRGSPAIEIIASLRARGIIVAYHDPFVPELRLPDGSVLRSVDAPRGEDYELVLAHTLQPGVDAGDIANGSTLLDATYRLGNVPGRVLA